MIIVTGAAGFIGSCLCGKLNQLGYEDLLLVDSFDRPEKAANWVHKAYKEKVDRSLFFDWIRQYTEKISFVIHLGARTDTTEHNRVLLDELNTDYSKKIWAYCAENSIPLIYASSAATYGAGEFGYEDDHSKLSSLHPLNPYGESKQKFDVWALAQKQAPPFWAGLKFFNVYGPNEYHKGRMASVIFHTFHKVKASGKMELFRSHKENYEDGMQLRDFVYVKDVVQVISFLMENRSQSGIYNLGTGHAESFLTLAEVSFDCMGIKRNISFIDIPEDIRENYQYFTEACIKKLRKAGYTKDFYSLSQGVHDYISNYLTPGLYY